jgi:hypothetical protein
LVFLAASFPLSFSLNGRDQVSLPYRTTGKTIVVYIRIFTFFDSNREERRIRKNEKEAKAQQKG